MKRSIIYLTGIIIALSSSCNEEFEDPSTLKDDEVFSNTAGLISAVVGAQEQWTLGRLSPLYNAVSGAELTTGGLFVVNAGNADEFDISRGKNNLLPENRVLSNLWEQSLLTRYQSQLVIDNLGVVNDPEVAAGIEVYASIFIALANGTLIQFFEQVPLESGQNASFSDRQAVLSNVINTLENARTILNTTTISQEFYDNTPQTIDLENTVNALLARFYLINGDYTAAITAADRVDLTVPSVFGFDDLNLNPLAEAIISNNRYQPRDLNLGLSGELTPDPGDHRLAFYAETDSTFRKFSDTDSTLTAFGAGFFDVETEAVPVYLPGEVLLIKAEAYARSEDLDNAIIELNRVLTKTAADDIFGIGAGLEEYPGPMDEDAILLEIYKNRCIELFMSGLKLEDSKRFNRPGPNEPGEERNRNLYPYPNSEINNNTNTPPNPAI